MKSLIIILFVASLPMISPAHESYLELGTMHTFSPPSSEKHNDSWLGMDKFLHVAACASITGLSYHVYHCQYNNPIDRSVYFSLSLAGASGIGKEFYDARVRRIHWSWKDIVADGVGIAIGYLLFIHIDT